MLTTRICLSLGLVGSFTIGFTPAVQAQLRVTDGIGKINNAEVFVPNSGVLRNYPSGTETGSTDARGFIYRGNFNGVLIQTDRGNLPANLLFRAIKSPAIDGNSVNNPPTVGSTSIIEGRVSFRTFSPQGEPIFFNQVPSTINVRFTQVPNPIPTVPTREFSARDFILTERGTVSDPGSISVFTRASEVDFQQYRDDGLIPTDQKIFNLNVPASAYNQARDGYTLKGDFGFDIMGGTVGNGNIQTFAQPNTENRFGGNNINPGNPAATNSSRFINQGLLVIYLGSGLVYQPGLDREVQLAVDTGKTLDGLPSGNKGEIVYIDQKNRKTYIAVGLQSRIFPSFVGLEQIKR
jgi:hypothetical protein